MRGPQTLVCNLETRFPRGVAYLLIEVRFKNQGLDLIEVQDNGGGITPENYETVALKHHTSKLSTYADLTTLLTFGFRGEALSSLCALSQFTIITCMAGDAPKGTKLDFKISGELKGTSVVAAQKGTTVSVENLFNNLPVRRKELERNIKREWNRVIGVLNQYACIQTGVKISVTSQAAKGRKTNLFSTKGNPTTRENIINVFGMKTLTALLALDLKLELEPTSGPNQRWSAKDDGHAKEIRISGHVSRPASGEGRQTPDRQMFFVNSRPCGLPQVAKVFNEVYRSYNSTQSPFIFANIEMDTHLYDVNVSPDKRTILLHDQSRMLDHLKTSLTALFETQDYTVPISQFPAQKQLSYKQLTIGKPKEIPSSKSQLPRVSKEGSEEDEDKTQSQSGSSSDEEDVEEIRPLTNQNSNRAPASALTIEPSTRDGNAVSLTSVWLSKDTQNRKPQKDAHPKPVVQEPAEVSRTKLKLIGKFSRESITVESLAESPQGTERSTTPGTPDPSLRASESFQNSTQGISDAMISSEDEQDVDDTGSAELEEPIPAIVSPAKLSSINGLPSTASRPYRSSATAAIITIGDHTITSSIGTQSPKRSRVRVPAQVPAAKSIPSFRNQLTRRFAAPGTQSSVDVEASDLSEEEHYQTSAYESLPTVADDNEEDHEDEDEHSSESHTHGEGHEAIEDDFPMPKSFLISSGDPDAEYLDDDEKKAKEDAKVQEMIDVAEMVLTTSESHEKRSQMFFKGGARNKDKTTKLVAVVDTTIKELWSRSQRMSNVMDIYENTFKASEQAIESFESRNAEEKLSLTINKTDFAKMKIVGQFNMGFILATRAANASDDPDILAHGDDLFIIDQHASDEKYNFERLQASTVVQSQRLVRPKTLDLTAVEEEIVMENLEALETNGFIVRVDDSGESMVGQRCQLVSLPLSRETTFSLSDLEELISLLSDHPSGSIPRPTKVRKMFAMRACRSSIMIGTSLSPQKMERAVRHMGEIDKPWNCPHGRPTMRHLCGLGAWDDVGWKEGDGFGEEKESPTNWAAWVMQKKAEGL
jgi:DNA mismatch repair protein PMS2